MHESFRTGRIINILLIFFRRLCRQVLCLRFCCESLDVYALKDSWPPFTATREKSTLRVIATCTQCLLRRCNCCVIYTPIIFAHFGALTDCVYAWGLSSLFMVRRGTHSQRSYIQSVSVSESAETGLSSLFTAQ